MAKEKLVIYEIEEEENPDGIMMARVTLKKGDKTYLRGVRSTDLADPKTNKSIFKHWKNDIEKIEQAQARPENEKKAIKANIEAMKGEEISDE